MGAVRGLARARLHLRQSGARGTGRVARWQRGASHTVVVEDDTRVSGGTNGMRSALIMAVSFLFAVAFLASGSPLLEASLFGLPLGNAVAAAAVPSACSRAPAVEECTHG